MAGLPAMVAVYRASAAQARGDVAGTVAHARRALDLAGPGDHFPRGAAGGFLGLAAWAEGDLATAVDTFGAAVEDLRAAGNATDVLGSTVVLAAMWTGRGRPDEARRLLERALEGVAASPGVGSTVAGDLHVALADVLREEGDLDAAEHHLDAAAELGDRGSLLEHRHRWYTVSAGGPSGARGDLDGAVAMLDEAAAHVIPGFLPDLRPVPAQRARVRIAQGRLAEAREWAPGAPGQRSPTSRRTSPSSTGSRSPGWCSRRRRAGGDEERSGAMASKRPSGCSTPSSPRRKPGTGRGASSRRRSCGPSLATHPVTATARSTTSRAALALGVPGRVPPALPRRGHSGRAAPDGPGDRRRRDGAPRPGDRPRHRAAARPSRDRPRAPSR